MKNHWIKEYNKKGLIGYLRSRYCKKQIVSNYDEDYFKSIPDNYPSEVDYVIYFNNFNNLVKSKKESDCK